jgi:uncharacterized membrane protein
VSRYALLLSTDTYQDATLRQLRSPRTDAETLARVLGDPEIADFAVRTLHNVPSQVARIELNDLFESTRGDDLVVVYFSCHGVKDDRAKLYFASLDTLHNRLPATAISADYVSELMDASPARRIVLFLDCCFSGAFARGMRTRAGGQVDVLERFTGRGRAVISATNAMEYAFELEQDAIIDADPTPTPSIFTSALIRGLTTGEADRGGDGFVSVDELYEYIFDQVRAQTTKQTPSRWFDVEGSLVLARVRHELPETLREQITDPLPSTRLSAVPELWRFVLEASPSLAQAARQALQQLTEDDSRSVSTEATRALRALPSPKPLPQPPQPPPSQQWVVGEGYSLDRLAVGWRATIGYLFCFLSAIPFVVNKRPEVRFNAWQSILFDGAMIVVFMVGAIVAGIADSIIYEGTAPTNSVGVSVFASVDIALYYGGRLLLILQVWRGKHFRLPIIGKVAEALALKR